MRRGELKIKSYIFAGLAWLIPLISFYFALSREVQLEDSGELITAALTWGVPHPSGYPTYILLGNLWVLILGRTAVNINLLSASTAALACFLVYKIVTEYGTNRWLGVLAAWLLAWFPAFWSQALLAEVYTLHAAWVAAWLLAGLRFYHTRQYSWFYFGCLLLGLSLGNHLVTIFLLPVWLAMIYCRRTALSKRVIGNGLLFLLAGLAVYFYLPSAAAFNPPLNWGNPLTWKDFWHHVLRFSYDDFGVVSVGGSKIGLLIALFRDIIDGLGWPVIAVLVLGWGLLARRQFWLAVILSAVVVAQSLPIIILRRYGWGIGLEFTYQVYWSGALVGLAVLIGLSAGQLWQYIKLRLSHRGVISQAVAFSVSLLILPWSVWLWHWQIINYRQDNFPHHYGQALLEYLPPQAILFINTDGYAGDSLLFTLLYEQMVRRVRSDVLMVDVGVVLPLPAEIKKRIRAPLASESKDEISNNWLKAYWQYAEKHHRPLYTTSLPVLTNSSFAAKPDGYAYRVFGSVAEASLLPTVPRLVEPELWHKTRLNVYSGQDYIAQLNYFQAAALLSQQRLAAARGALQDAINYDNEPFSSDYRAFLDYRRWLNSAVCLPHQTASRVSSCNE